MPFDVDDFEQDVLAASREQPVLVDFWAPWCGPCRTLGPVLERLAAEQDAAWRLAKVNIDDHGDLARRYGVRGIPAVKLFADGTVLDEFTGALPEHALRRWLSDALPSKVKADVEAAEATLARGDRGEAEALLRGVLDAEPDDPVRARAQVLLAQAVVFEKPDEAAALTEEASFVDAGVLERSEAVQTVARLLRLREVPEALPEGPGRAPYRRALSALAEQDFDAALQHLIEVVRADRYYDDDGARKACVALFTLLGTGHPAVRAHRRTFDMALY